MKKQKQQEESKTALEEYAEIKLSLNQLRTSLREKYKSIANDFRDVMLRLDNLLASLELIGDGVKEEEK